MEQGKIQVWQQAIEIYADIADLSVNQALVHVDSLHNLSYDIKQAVITLINSGSQASRYIQDHYTPSFDVQEYQYPEIKLGTQLGEYELVEKLGQGGMSQVFKAKRLDSEAQKMVAIKIFAPKHHSQLMLDRFVTEQQILSGFSHPNIVDMLHSGKSDNNTAYLVMELIDNALTLDKYSAKENLSVKQNIAIIERCAKALAYSHANLIIHRDLKPDNILINGNNQVKIVDFGIAKLINNDVDGNNATIMALTPNYAAPEQVNSQAITVKTDIFSLAVVALEILCQAPPLPKDRLIKSCINDDEFINKNLKKVNCDKDLKNILRKALEQNPDNRYSSIQSFSDDLNNWLNHRPVNATSPSVVYRIKKFSQRRTALFTTLVSFIAFLIIGSILGYQQYRQIKIEASKAQQIKQFMLDSFAVTNPNFSKGIIFTAEDVLNTAGKKLLNEKNIAQETKFELLQTIGIAYSNIGFFKNSTDFFAQSLDIQPKDSRSTAFLLESLYYSEAYDELNLRLNNLQMEQISSTTDRVKILTLKGMILSRNLKFDEAKMHLDKALNLSKQSNDQENILLTTLELANLFYLQSDTHNSISLLESALRNHDLPNNNSIVMELRSNLGKYYYRLGEYDKVIKILDDLAKQQRRIFGGNSPWLGLTLSILADAYSANGQLKAAQKLTIESYHIFSSRYGENSTKTAAVMNSLAILYYQNGDIEKTIDLMYKVKTSFEVNFPDSINTYDVKSNLALMLSKANRNAEAVKIAQGVYDSLLIKLGPEHDSTIYSQSILATSLAKIGQIEYAINLGELANTNSIKYLGINHPTTAGTYVALGHIYRTGGNFPAAIKNFSVIVDKQLYQKNNPKYAPILVDLAELFAEINDSVSSQLYFVSAIETYNNLYTKNHLKAINIKLKYAEYLKNHGYHEKLRAETKQLQAIISVNAIDDKDILKRLYALY